MDLDFTRLDKLGLEGFTEEAPEKSPSKTLSEPRKGSGEYKNPARSETPSEGLTEGLGALQRKADRNKAEKDRSLEVYRHYQENIRRSGQLQTDILKGLKAGEDIYSLFLKAVEVIGLMTDNGVYLTQIKGDLRSIYGKGLQEPAPLRLDLAETEERLARLREAEARETEQDSLQRIKRAIKEHESRVAELEAHITKAKGKPA